MNRAIAPHERHTHRFYRAAVGFADHDVFCGARHQIHQPKNGNGGSDAGGMKAAVERSDTTG